MNRTYLEVTYRRGRPLAAYYYLPRQAEDRSARSERHGGGLVVDFHADGRPLGIEITSPEKFTLVELNAILRELGQSEAEQADFAPLLAA